MHKFLYQVKAQKIRDLSPIMLKCQGQFNLNLCAINSARAKSFKANSKSIFWTLHPNSDFRIAYICFKFS